MKTAVFVLFCIIAVTAVFLGTQGDVSEKMVALADDIIEEIPAAASPSPTIMPTPTIIPTPTVKPAVTTDPTMPPTTTVKVSAVGDLMCLYGQLSSARHGGQYVFDQCFAQIQPIISKADIAMGNLETLVAESFSYTGPKTYEEKTIIPSDGSAPYTTTVSTGGNPKLNAPESYLKAVVECGFDVLATANNHSFDRGHDGVVETMQKLDEYGIKHTGSYADAEDKKPLIVAKNGIIIGILSYTDLSNCKPSSKESYMLDRYSDKLFLSDIKAAKEAGAEFVVVYIHWGTANTHSVNKRQRKIAQFIADSGADLILGSHPHCTQEFDSIETEHGTVPIIYSMGNLISSMGKTINKDSVIVNFELEKNYTEGTVRLTQLSYIPTLCTATDAGNHIILPTSSEYLAQSPYASSLESSRKRTVKVLGETVALPE